MSDERPFCPELEDLGGGRPLYDMSDREILLAASDVLLSYANGEDGERRNRLLLLAGFVRGFASRKSVNE